MKGFSNYHPVHSVNVLALTHQVSPNDLYDGIAKTPLTVEVQRFWRDGDGPQQYISANANGLISFVPTGLRAVRIDGNAFCVEGVVYDADVQPPIIRIPEKLRDDIPFEYISDPYGITRGTYLELYLDMLSGTGHVISYLRDKDTDGENEDEAIDDNYIVMAAPESFGGTEDTLIVPLACRDVVDEAQFIPSEDTLKQFRAGNSADTSTSTDDDNA